MWLLKLSHVVSFHVDYFIIEVDPHEDQVGLTILCCPLVGSVLMRKEDISDFSQHVNSTLVHMNIVRRVGRW